MHQIDESFFEQVERIFQQYYLTALEQKAKHECQHMRDMVSIADQLKEGTSDSLEHNQHVAEITYKFHELMDKSWDLPASQSYAARYEVFVIPINELIEMLDEIHILEQSKDRFYRLEGENFWTGLVKSVKRLCFYTTDLPRKTANIFRKEKKPIQYWNHTVPFRNLARRHYQSKLAEDFKGISDVFFFRLIKEFESLKSWYESKLNAETGLLDTAAMEKRIDDFYASWLAELKTKSDDLIVQRKAAFLSEYERIDTLELSSACVSASSLEKQIRTSDDHWSSHNFQWRNTIYALFEDWRSDLDLYAMKYHTLSELAIFRTSQVKKVSENIDSEIEQIQDFISQSLTSLDKPDDTLTKSLKKLHYQTVKKLDRDLVPKLTERLADQSIVNLLNKLEVSVCQEVEELTDEHIIVKSGVYDRPMKEDDFHEISINELVTFEILASFQKRLGGLKTQLFTLLEAAADQVKDIDHIITFSLNSALTAADEGKKAEEVVSIAQEGFKRADARLIEIRTKIEQSLSEINEQLVTIVDEFNDKLIALCQNENSRGLKLRITKAKAALQAKQVRTRILDQIKEKSLRAWELTLSKYSSAKTLVEQVSGRFILTAGKPALTKQVSDFLFESQQVMNKLPLIYQRLFRIEPLDDLELFEGREEELVQLKAAFDNWNLGRFGATVILGEKWGGLTTFINYTIKQAKFTYKITRQEYRTNIHTRMEFIASMNTLLETDGLTSIDDLVTHLKDGPKRIVILEDIQNLYLRKINGFEALVALNELISRTGHHIFWMATSTVYCWNYLKHAIQIQEYFSYIIPLAELADNQIINLVWKRNQISGFNIQFVPDEQDLNDKKFAKLTEEEQQAKLKKEFFSDLTSFAKSNVSMSLIFWLLSTRKIEENHISIGSFNKPNLNFLKSLTMDKVYLLHALIMHDGLTSSQVSEVLHSSDLACRQVMMALLEDGIIFEEDEVFMINPILYRDMINLMISKNLIH